MLHLASALVVSALLGSATDIVARAPAGVDDVQPGRLPPGWLDDNSQDEAKIPPRTRPPSLPLPPIPRRVRVWGFVVCADRVTCPPHPLPYTIRTDRRSWDRRIYLPEDYNPPVRLSPTGEPLLPHVVLAAVSEDGRTTWETRSYADGRYSLTIPPGKYRIVVDEPPYAPYETFINVPDIELHGPNPLVDGDVQDGPDFIPFDAMRLDLALTPDPDPHRCPAIHCGSCARCLTSDAYDMGVDGRSKTLVHGVDIVAVNPEGRRWYSRTQNGLVIFSTLPEGWYYIVATYPPPARRDAPTDGWKYVGGRANGKAILSIATARFGLGDYIEVTASWGAEHLGGVGGGTAFHHQQIEFRPLLPSRSMQSLQALVPGIVMTEQTGSLAQFSALGQRRFANRLTIDGVSADLAVDVLGPGIDEAGSGTLPAFATSGGTQTLVPLAAVHEFQIRTSNAPPEQARTPGAQTSIVTRAGTKTFQGAMFGNARPRQLAAADYFPTISGQPRRFSSTNGGASLGGPLGLGALTFFSAAEVQHIDRPYEATVAVPSQSLRDTAPTAVRPILAAFPVPNGRELGGGLAEFSHVFPLSSSLGVVSLRTDITRSAYRLFTRVNVGGSRGNTVRTPGQQPDFSHRHTESTKTRTATAGVTSIWSTFVNELRFNVSTNEGALVASTSPYGGARPLPLDGLVAPNAINPWVRATVLPTTSGSGSLAEGRTGGARQDQWAVANTLTMLHKGQELRIGLDLTRVVASTPASTRYTYTLTPLPQLLQWRGRLTIEERDEARALFESVAWFAQNTHRATSRLTLTYGVRYSINPAPTSQTALRPSLVAFDTLPTLEPRATAAPLWRTSWTNAAPHVGGAFQLVTTSDREVTLRVGWDRVYDELTTPGGIALGRGAPYVSTRILTPQPLPIPTSEMEMAPTIPELTERYAFADLRPPYTQRWHVGLDRALGRTQRLSVAYVGAAARDLVYRYAYVPERSAPVYAFSNAASSDYHALFVDYARRSTRGVQGSITYAWSHAIDVDSGENLAPSLPPEIFAPRGNRGSADYDRRHVLQGRASYRIPSARISRFASEIVEGWQLDVVGTFRSGAPTTVTTVPSVGAISYVIRPDVLPGVPMWLDDPTSPSGRRINPAALDQPSEPRQGTLGRNTFRGSPLRQIDLALSRSTRVASRLIAQLRIEAFNVLNMSNFGPPYGSYPNEAFGRPRESAADALGTGTLTEGGLVALQHVGGPRSVQIGFGFSW